MHIPLEDRRVKVNHGFLTVDYFMLSHLPQIKQARSKAKQVGRLHKTPQGVEYFMVFGHTSKDEFILFFNGNYPHKDVLVRTLVKVGPTLKYAATWEEQGVRLDGWFSEEDTNEMIEYDEDIDKYKISKVKVRYTFEGTIDVIHTEDEDPERLVTRDSGAAINLNVSNTVEDFEETGITDWDVDMHPTEEEFI
jgi:hypothetical protein